MAKYTQSFGTTLDSLFLIVHHTFSATDPFPDPIILGQSMSTCDPRNVLAQRRYDSPWCEILKRLPVTCETCVKVKGLDHLQAFLFWHCGEGGLHREAGIAISLCFFWKKINYKIALKTGRKELFALKAMKGERAKCHQKCMIHWQKSKQHTIPTRGWMHEQPKQVMAGFTRVWGWTWNHLIELDIILEANTWSERYACNAF